MHNIIMFENCKPLGCVRVTKAACFIAERCLCDARGELVRSMHSRYCGLDRAFKAAIGAAYKATVHKKPLLVLEMSCTPPGERPAIMDDDSVNAAGISPTRSYWFHVSFVCENPVRPVFASMRRLPDNDEHGRLGVTPVTKVVDGRTIVDWKLLYEMIMSLPLDDVITIVHYRLVATTRKVLRGIVQLCAFFQ
jgi:hypothetical protein